jgi:hypothetical protein
VRQISDSIFKQRRRQASMISRRDARVVQGTLPPLITEGAGKAGCPPHPQPRVGKNNHTSVVTTGVPDQSGLPCAMVYGLFRALPGDRACLSPSPAEMNSADLTPASRRQDHTTSPSAGPRPRQKRSPASTASRPASVTIAIRPSVGRDGGSCRSDLPDGLSEIFLQEGLDSLIAADLPVGQIREDVVLRS